MNSDGAFSDGGDISELSDLYRAIDELKEVKTERDALREALTTLLREHDSAPDAKGSDGWDAARKLLEGE